MPNKTNDALNEKLISAVKKNDIEQAKKLIAEGADVNCKIIKKFPSPLRDETRPLLLHVIQKGRISPSQRVSVNTLRFLLEKGAKVDEEGESNYTALIWAIWSARPELVALFLEFGAEPVKLVANELTPLDGVEECLEYYTNDLHSGRPSRLEDLKRMTGYSDRAEAAEKWIECRNLLTHRIEELEKEAGKPLIRRVRRSDSDIENEQFEQLMKNAELSAREVEQLARNANLFKAFRKKSWTWDGRFEEYEKVKEALNQGANVNAQYDNINDKNTPLHLAVKIDEASIVALLLQRGANVLLKNNKEETPLALVKNNSGILERLKSHANEKLISAVEIDNTDRVKQLIAVGADVNCKEKNRPLLIYALRAAEHFSHIDEEGRSYRVWVSVNTLRCLLENGARVNEHDDRGKTALYWAIWQARPEVVALLLEFGADPRERNKEEETPLDLAERFIKIYTQEYDRYSFCSMTLMELEKQTGYGSCYRAAEKWKECRELLLRCIEELEKEEGKSLKRERRSDSSSGSGRESELIKDDRLFNAIRKKDLTPDVRLEKVKEALERGANVNAQYDNIRHKNTPLHLAVKKGQEETVVFLLQRGANVELKNGKGETPLDLAKNNPGILKLLTEHVSGADLEAVQPVINVDSASTSSDISLPATANRFALFSSESTKDLLALKDLEINTPPLKAVKTEQQEEVTLSTQKR